MRSILNPNEVLRANEKIVSPNGLHTLIMQGDGNLVLYFYDGQALWNSKTNGTDASYVIMQADGNLVIYNDSNQPKWHSQTNGNQNAFLVLQDDGNLVIYTTNNQPVWATYTTVQTPNICKPFLQEIKTLELGVKSLQNDLQSASPAEKPGIVFEIKELQREIQEKHKKFEDCVVKNGGNLPPKAPPLAKVMPTIPKPFSGKSAYLNSRPDKDSNTCGQAAIATMLGYLGKDPFKLPRNANGRWNDGEVIDSIISDGFGPNVLFGAFGTSSGKIKDALNHYGIYTEDWNGGFMRTNKKTVLDKLKYWLDLDVVVPVMVGSNGLFDGTNNWIQDNIGYTQYHWPIVYKIERGTVYLSAPEREMSISSFMEIWSCQPLLYPYGYNAIFCFPWLYEPWV